MDTASTDGAHDGATRCATNSDCDDGVFCNGAETCAPTSATADARGCVSSASGPCTGMQRCDETMDRCVSDCATEPDSDGDMHRSTACGGDDCDDNDALRHPGATEICDAMDRDEDCDPRTFGFRDADGDGAPDALCCNAEASGMRHCGDDCNDSRPAVHPGSAEVCNGLDDDCNGTIDEGVTRTFHPDRDGDGFGDSSGTTVMGCNPPAGYAEMGTDCDDTVAAVHPGAVEVCDAANVDEDCDGVANPPSLCTCAGTSSRPCALPGACAAGTERCVSGSWGACSIAPVAESCNGVDDDCDGMIDEALTVTCYADADNDGYAATGAMTIQSCPVAGRESVGGCPSNQTDRMPMGAAIDCDDANATVRPGAPEGCNGADDDCNGLVDDVMTGTTFCRAGEMGACTSACGAMGTHACSATCLSWGACVAPEVCNGCDDDANGATDDGFACARGTSGSCVVPVCGTTGTRNCDSACAWGACTAMEACNYCDDNGNGNINEERPLATSTSNDHFSDCSAATQPMFGSATMCDVQLFSGGFDLWATLLDGTAVPQAGAMWLDPSAWSVGWGPIDVTISMEVTAVSGGGTTVQMPLGGWGVVIGHGGTLGVGTANDGGVPRTIDGVAARWFWSNFDVTSTAPPVNQDAVRAMQLRSGMITPLRTGPSDTGSGQSINGSATSFDGPASGTITEQITLRYTPDDPTTATTNEESITLTAGTPGSPVTYTYTPSPSNVMPVGTSGLRIGITAGTYSQSGFTGPPAGTSFGVPVQARVRVMHQQNTVPTPMITFPQTISRRQICP